MNNSNKQLESKIDPFANKIRRLPISTKTCESIAWAWAEVTKTKALLLPMVMALGWVTKHKEYVQTRVQNACALESAILEDMAESAYKRLEEHKERG